MSHLVRWTIEKIAQRLALIDGLVYRRQVDLPNFRYYAVDENPGTGIEILPNTYWGEPCTEFVLRSTFEIPAEWGVLYPVALYLPLGDAENFSHPEALVSIDGQTFATCDLHHREILLSAELSSFGAGEMWKVGCVHDLELRGWTGMGDNWNSVPLTRLVMHTSAVVQIDQPTRDFIISARIGLETAKILDINDPTRTGLLNALDAAFKILDTREPFGDRFYESVPLASAALKEGLACAGAALPVSMTATGHAHIDVAWLWTLDQTRRKTARTFHTVLRLMEQFPEYHFTQSQPQLYEYIRQDYPQVFAAIQARVAEGRWEPIGGMWVEADCNLSGAESLARQFLLGRSYFRQHFGAQAESGVLWLPDVFGYAWALPQLIKQSGLDYFFTIKLGWNQYNHLPYDSFWWQGLDGTRVLTHFGTAPENGSAYASTYNAPATPDSTLGAWKNFQQKEAQTDVFMAFGYGDGGGGPTREMLENLREMAHFPGLPQVRQRSAGEFFHELETQSGADLPTWNGELYLEYHRGTYTTQSRNKRANRKSEFSLHDAEFLASLTRQLDPNYTYPVETITQAWQLVCLNQFHDIIPGSSIGQVYTESLEQYHAIEQIAETVRRTALDSLSVQFGGDLLLVNPTSFSRRDLAFVPEDYSAGLERAGQHLVTQAVVGGLLVDAGELPPYSLTPLYFSEKTSGAPATCGLFAAPNLLENDYLRVELSADGDITRIFDKANRRDVLPEGAIANQFQAFEDRPKFWDAWDIDIFYDDKFWLAEAAGSIRVLEAGPLRATLEIKRRILNSSYTQHISLIHNSPRLDFETTIDWRERHILLKVAFPVEILAPVATYEIQWGNVQRPTHRNTSWDWARFETCAHKWVDLGEGGYGVSLLNDCKYGHDIRDNVMRISLLRAPTIPDPEADQGEQGFSYSLLPHSGGWEGSTALEAYTLNDPIRVHGSNVKGHAAQVMEPLSFVSTSSSNIIIETVKGAEDGNGVIVRFYESQRRRGEVTLTAAFPLARVEKVNLLEDSQAELKPIGQQVTLSVRPYEIVSLRLIFG
ncbi:MAG: alpha-mannosidase [Chloroflexi bacterium]|nr:alpha-mannosidase [Chloroflexota bacterium]